MPTPISSGSYNYNRETSTSASRDFGSGQPPVPAPNAGGPNVPLLEDSFELGGTAASRDVNFGGPDSTVQGQASVDVGEASLSGETSVTADLSEAELNADLSVDASVYAVNASGSVSADLGIVDAAASGSAQVGATGNGTASVSFDPLDGDLAATVEAEAFAGVRAGGEVSGSIGPVGATAGGEVLVGVGAEFEADIGFEDGEFSAHVDIGASLGIGLSLEFEINVDVGAIAEGVGNFVGDVAGAVGDFFSGW